VIGQGDLFFEKSQKTRMYHDFVMALWKDVIESVKSMRLYRPHVVEQVWRWMDERKLTSVWMANVAEQQCFSTSNSSGRDLRVCHLQDVTIAHIDIDGSKRVALPSFKALG